MMALFEWQLGAHEHEHLSEVDLLVREDGGRQVHSRKRFGRSRKCCPSRAGRFLECPVSWRDHRHSGLRGPLYAIEERAHATHLRSLVEEDLRRARFRSRHEDTAGMVSRTDRAHTCEHELHFVDAPDAVCKTQLRDRSRGLPAGTRWTTEEDFEAINAYFQPPSEDDNFKVVHHERI